jgi:hypothetical protein
MPNWHTPLPVSWGRLRTLLADDTTRAVMSRAELTSHALALSPSLDLPAHEQDDALRVLRNRGTILLFDSMPDVVFARPQLLIRAVTGIVQQALAAPTSPFGRGVLEHARLGFDILGSAEEQVLLPHTCRLDVFKRKTGVIFEAFRDLVLFSGFY